MSNDPYTLFRRSAFRFAGLLAVAGCSTPAKVGNVPAVSAHVSVANLTDYSWRIEITSETGARHFTALLEPRRSAELDLPGGGYQIEQSIQNPTDRPAAPRHFTAQLTAGKIYHWPLATLQSDGAEERTGVNPGE